MDATHSFHIADYVVFALTIAVSLSIGIYFAVTGNKKMSNTEYLLGGRTLKVIPVAVSILVTFVSTIGILGNPVEVYLYGTQFMLDILANIIGTVLGVVVFVPLYYPLKLVSTFEYQKLRFNSTFTEMMCSGITLFNMLLFNGILIFSPCVAFEAVSGFPVWASVLICGLSGTIYTTLGGMKAVVWTDVFQSVLILTGLIAIVTLGTIKTGGIAEVWRINNEWNHIQFFNFSVDPTERLTFWSVVVINSFLWMSVSIAQPCVQRYCSLPTMKKAKSSLLIMVVGFCVSGLLNCVIGVTAFAFYAKQGCDPIISGKLKNPNQIVPYFVMDVMNYPPLPGIFIACLFSASLSSVSSCLNSMAAMTWQNMIRYKYNYLSDRKQAQVAKILTLIYGVLSIGIAFLVKEIGGTLIQITYSVLGAVGGPILGTIFLGALWPRAGAKSTVLATVIALTIVLWMSMGSNFNHKYSPPIGGPIDQCSVSVPCLDPNSTAFGGDFNATECVNVTPSSVSSTVASNVTQAMMAVAEDHLPPWLRWLYSVSYFYYAFIGAFLVLLIGMLLSFIPGLDMPSEDVPSNTLFPFVANSRFCWASGDPKLPESMDSKPKELQPMVTASHPRAPDAHVNGESTKLQEKVPLTPGYPDDV